jgi:hypothetical protein
MTMPMVWETWPDPAGDDELLRGKDCAITLGRRPHYCDRGNFLAQLDYWGKLSLEIDAADGWPRYYFDRDRAKLEIEAWLQKRGQVLDEVTMPAAGSPAQRFNADRVVAAWPTAEDERAVAAEWKPAMTFGEFVATRQEVDDLFPIIKDEGVTGPGFVYLGGLYIEKEKLTGSEWPDAHDGVQRFHLPIENSTQLSHDLGRLELTLYTWAMSAGYGRTKGDGDGDQTG